MKITQKFLKSLNGLTKDAAEAEVKAVGLTPLTVESGMAITMQVRLNTVVLWLNPDGLVDDAGLG